VLLSTLVIATGCAPKKPAIQRSGRPADDSDAVLTVDGEDVTLRDFQWRLNSLPVYAHARYATIEQQQNFINAVLQFEVMADVAEQRGYGDDPRVVDHMMDAAAEEIVDQRVREEQGELTDAAVRAYYDAHIADYSEPRKRRASIFVAADRDAVAGVVSDVRRLDASRRLDVFAQRARAASISPTASVGGDAGWFVEPTGEETDGWKTRTAPRVFALAGVGAVSDPFEIDGRWTAVIVSAVRPAQPEPFDDVEAQVRQALREHRRDAIRTAYLRELRKRYDVDVEKKRLVELARSARSKTKKSRP